MELALQCLIFPPESTEGEFREALSELWTLLKAARDAGKVISVTVQGGIPLRSEKEMWP